MLKTNRFEMLARATVLALAGLAVGSGAQAITLQKPSQKGANILLNNFDSGTSYSTSWTGAVSITANGGSPFWAYCIDPKTTTKWGQNLYTSASLTNFLNADIPPSGLTGYEQQFGKTGSSSDNGAYVGLDYQLQNTLQVEGSLNALFSHAYYDSLSSNTKAAAFGYVVWEIMGDADVDGNYASNSGRSDGSNSAGDALRTLGSASGSLDSLDQQIDAYLTALNTNSWGSVNGANLSTATDFIYTVYFDTDSHQAQNFLSVIENPGNNNNQTPEPGSMALAGLALVGLFGAQRRRKEAAAA